MNEDKCWQILNPDMLKPDGGLYDAGWYLNWNISSTTARCDGDFTADQLEAIAWWMRNGKVQS